MSRLVVDVLTCLQISEVCSLLNLFCKTRSSQLSLLLRIHCSITMKLTLGGDKVNMLTHTYPHKPLRKIKVTK